MHETLQEPLLKHLFLDLENTVISPVVSSHVSSWADTELINTLQVKAFLDSYRPDYLHVFSFAIWNQDDLAGFNWSVRPRLEKAFGMQFSTVPLLDTDIRDACCNRKWLKSEDVGRKQVIDYWGKQDAFRLYAQQKYGQPQGILQEVVLLDDQVTSEEFFMPSLRLKGRLIDIAEIC